MHDYEFLCRLCNRPFSKSPTPFESQRRQSGLSTRCGSEEVERRWFYRAPPSRAREQIERPDRQAFREHEFRMPPRPSGMQDNGALCLQRNYENSSIAKASLI